MNNILCIIGAVSTGIITGVILLNFAGQMNVTVKNKDRIIFTTENLNE
jgi:hypothetical protein